jgi:hypothetical protein
MKRYLKVLIVLMCLPIVSCASFYQAYNTEQLYLDKDIVVYKHHSSEPWRFLVDYCAKEHCKVYDKLSYLMDSKCNSTNYCVTTFECR